MPQKGAADFDFSMFDGAQPPPLDAFDFSALQQPEPPKDKRSTFARAVDAATTPMVSEDTARRASATLAGNGLEQQPDNSFSLMRSLADAVMAVPDVARNLIAHPRETLAGAVEGIAAPDAPFGVLADVAKNALQHPIATARGAAGGLVEGVQPFSDPLSVALTAAGPLGRVARTAITPALAAVKGAEEAIIAARAAGRYAEIPGLVKELSAARQAAAKAHAIDATVRGAEKAANVGMVLRGAERAATADKGDEALGGVGQTALGLVGLRMAPKAASIASPLTREVPRLPGQVRPDFVVTPAGVVGTPEAIPMQPAQDGSYVRAESGQFARHEIRGELPPAPLTVTPDGTVLPPGVSVSQPAARGRQADPSFVRAVRGQFARREPRGALPERASAANEIVVTPEGRAGRRADVLAPGAPSRLDDFDFTTVTEAPAAPAPKGRGRKAKSADPVATVPAAVADLADDGGPIYSSDPHAVSVRGVQLDADEQHELRRMLAEMENTEFTPHTFNAPGVGRGGAPEIVPGGGGAPVHQDILALHGSSASRDTIAEAMRRVLAGEKTAYGPAIRQVIRLRRDGRLGAMLPPDAGDLRQSGEMSNVDQGEFDRFVDRLSTQDASDREWFGAMGREPGEEGRINQALLQHLAGGAAGAVIGGAQGDTLEDKIRGAFMGGAVGATLPGLAGQRPARMVRVNGLATLGDQLKAKGITPESLDARLSQLEPSAAVRPAFPDPMEGTYQRVLQQGGRGERGALDAALASHLGGAVAGGVVGAVSGDTTEERITRGLMGAAAGAAAPGVIRKLRGRVLATGNPAGPTRIVNARVVASDVASEFPTTARKPGAPDTPHADPLAGTDVFLSKFPEEVRGGIRQILEDNRGFDAQRRGVVRPETTERLAEAVAIDLSKSLKRGTALNAQGVRAYADALAGAQTKVNELAQKVARGAATDADLLALEAAKAEAQTVAASIMGGRSEAGRALAEFKVLARVMRTGNPQLIQDAANGLREGAQEFARAFAQLPDDPIARYRWLQQQGKASVWDKTRSYYYANILSGLKTHERNILGNASNAIAGMVSQPFGATADVLRSLVTGKPREVLFSELPYQAAGALVGIPQGFREAMFTIRNGVTRAQLSGAMSAAEAGKLDLPRVEFGGGGANPFNYPGRGLDAVDQFFRSIARNQELYARTFQQAKREGLRGVRLQERMAHLATATDEVSQGIQAQADAFARRSVFQEKPGKLAQGLQLLAKQFPPLTFVMPFIKTPANIIRQGFEFSPAGFGMKAARAGGREGSQAMGKAAAGTVGVAYLAYLAATGRLSGSGPQNPAERAQLMESGWRPDSVKVGDTWVSYQTMQPISVPAAVVANAYESWRNAGADAANVDKAYAAILGTLRSQLNQSFLSGLADVFDAIEGQGPITGKATNVAGRIASGFVPFTGAQRTAAHAIDPVVRQARGVTETVAAGIPGLSSSVPSRLDRFGRDVTREGGPLRRAGDPFNVSTETTDPVVRELGRLGVTMGMPGTSVQLRGVDLTQTREDDRFVHQLKGSGTYEALALLLQTPTYRNLPDGRKADILRKVIEQARGKGGDAAKREFVRRALADTARAQPLKDALIKALGGGAR
jgi:hypothetical protein